ncbi:MAG: dephospho-CoA kinase [Alkalibacterium sp.]|nr:dephospho-CoA kinase [Alkalibacterium sp.]
MEPDEPAYLKVVDYFGKEIVNADRSIDRKRLGAIVFNDDEKLSHLNDLVHEIIFSEIMNKKKTLSKQDQSLIVLDIPLLYETGYDKYVDEVMVIYTDFTTQLTRLKHRDQLTDEEARNRIASQEPLETKRKKADVIIDNTGSVRQTIRQVDDWLTEKGYSSPL